MIGAAAPLTRIESLAVIGLAVVHEELLPVPSPHVAHMGASLTYRYLPCGQEKALRASSCARGGAAAPPPTSLVQLPLSRRLIYK